MRYFLIYVVLVIFAFGKFICDLDFVKSKLKIAFYQQDIVTGAKNEAFVVFLFKNPLYFKNSTQDKIQENKSL